MDPKADLTFKKVFGEHRDLVVSFLNALLPFDSPEEEIKEVLEYLDPELMPWWTFAAGTQGVGSSWWRCR